MPSMYEIYRHHRTEYDRLVAAEDFARHLPEYLRSIVDWRGRTVMEGGTGTGRVTEFYIENVRQAFCFDRESHMLEAARERFARFSLKLDLRIADNLSLPLLSEKADLFIEGWSWGHSIVDGPGPVEVIVDTLFTHVRKNLVADGLVVLIETLGTNSLTPSVAHPRLAEFYQLLQSRYGLHPAAISTDYRFPSVCEAADVLGFFFGDSMRQAVLSAGSPLIPEWTGIWYGPVRN